METVFRKISVGKDFPDGSIHYQVGRPVNLQSVGYIISSIAINPKYAKEDKTAYDIFITNTSGTLLWKTIYDVPVVVESNIDFE
jgi:hypothetical protein